ncbi:MCE family protein [Aliarcobacter cryaerophilus]|uniref:MCE family protein n=1 Tax=Aliarcobacter cryaerophilus TaxID=28198 RepID=A0A7G9LM67_9BACT|nr:MlaD family protein [Aliarcobacter cryaerophilus]QNM89716.1 MCE family protein [Aliarcobacter cryaerophilus]
MSNLGKETTVYKAKIEAKKRFSFIWLLPFMIFGILAWTAYDTYSKKGTNIVVYFKSAEGLKENVTPLEYKGLQLGKVTKISMDDDFKNVAVNILVNSNASVYVANENSQFWIKKPTVSLTKVSGLNTLVSGYKIELSTNVTNPKDFETAKDKWYFEGLEYQPDDNFDENSYYVTLLVNNKDNVDIGMPIFYNKFQIGEVISKNFKDEKLHATLWIYEKYRYLVNQSSEFVMNEALKVSYGAGGLHIELGSLYSALVGGITVTTPLKDKDEIKQDEIKNLYAKSEDLKKKYYFTINFQDSKKIDENSPILYRGLEVGKIVSVELDADLIVSKAFVYEEYKYLLTKNSIFFVEEPTISLDGIKNIGNIITGNYLTLEYKQGDFSDSFIAINKNLNSQNTFKIELIADSLNSINERSKIYFKNIEIGRVDSYKLTNDYKSVKVSILIDKNYKDLINDKTVFFDMSSKLLQMRNLQLDINYSGLDSILNGSIGVISTKENSKLTKKEFNLHNDYKEAVRLKRVQRKGFVVFAQFDNSFKPTLDMAVVYKNQEIGFVKNIKFHDTVSNIELFIYEEYKKYITNSSRFYKKPALDFKASLSGIIFEIDNFASLLDGSIELDNSSKIPLGNHEIYATLDDMNSATNSVTIIFDDVEGLQENFSKLTYKGANIGKVRKIRLNKNNQVEIDAIIFSDFLNFSKKGTVFYLKKPRISLQEVANLGAAVMGVDIGVIKGEGEFKRVFTGLNEEPSLPHSHFGTVFKVEDKTASSVNVDSPIYYKNVIIGKVSKVDLSSDGSRVIVDCLIEDKYKKLVRKNSKFYDISGFDMEFSIFGSKVQSSTVTSLIKGGFIVVTPYDYQEEATTKDIFILEKVLGDDWKYISPSIK